MTKLQTTCLNCSKKITFDPQHIGKTAKCPECKWPVKLNANAAQEKPKTICPHCNDEFMFLAVADGKVIPCPGCRVPILIIEGKSQAVAGFEPDQIPNVQTNPALQIDESASFYLGKALAKMRLASLGLFVSVVSVVGTRFIPDGGLLVVESILCGLAIMGLGLIVLQLLTRRLALAVAISFGIGATLFYYFTAWNTVRSDMYDAYGWNMSESFARDGHDDNAWAELTFRRYSKSFISGTGFIAPDNVPIASGPVTETAKPHGKWTGGGIGDKWFWFGETVTEGEFEKRLAK